MASQLVCPPEATPVFWITIHLVGAFSAPINIIFLYLIWFESPKVGNYKYCLTYLQSVSFMVETYMSWIGTGFYYFPMLGGFMASFLSNYISAHMSCVFFFFLFCFELPSLLLCFIYRYSAASELEKKNNTKNYFHYAVMFCAHTFPFVTAFCLLKSNLTYQQTYNIVKEFYPNCVHVVGIQGFIIYDFHTNFWTALVGISCMIYIFIFGWYGFFTAVRTVMILQKMRVHMSAQTYKMHKTALISLSLQVLAPVICLVFPINTIFIVIYFDLHELQEFANFMQVPMAAHSVFSSIIMILTNSRYRSVLLLKMERNMGRFLPIATHVGSSSSPEAFNVSSVAPTA